MNPLLAYLIQEIQYLNSGEVFLVKDMFKGYEWNRYSSNDRKNLGRLFLNEVENNKTLEVIKLEKTSANQQKYKKK